jgi:hypothetical protein
VSVRRRPPRHLIRQGQKRSLRTESSRSIRVVSNHGLYQIATPTIRAPHLSR